MIDAPRASSSSPAPRSGGSARSSRAWLIMLLVTLLGVTSDLASKTIAFRTIADQPVEVSREAVLLAELDAVGAPAAR